MKYVLAMALVLSGCAIDPNQPNYAPTATMYYPNQAVRVVTPAGHTAGYIIVKGRR